MQNSDVSEEFIFLHILYFFTIDSGSVSTLLSSQFLVILVSVLEMFEFDFLEDLIKDANFMRKIILIPTINTYIISIDTGPSTPSAY